MSLINDALKKAERQRADEADQAGAGATGGESPRVAKRGAAIPTQRLLLYAAAAVAIIIVSAVVTLVLATEKPKPKGPAKPLVTNPRRAPPSGPITVPLVVTSSPRPELIAPPPAAPAAPASAPAPAVAKVAPAPSPAAAPAPVPVPAAAPIPAAAAPMITLSDSPAAAAAPPAAGAPPPPDAAIQAIVDGLKVTGIRSSGADSRVLMGGRVFRVNDIVDRATGLKLTKATTDALTFVDANGVTYVKNF